MADGLEPNGSSPRAEQGHAELEVDGVAMVRLLGPQDRLLTTLEHQYPEVEVLVRGNRVNLDGPNDQVQAASRLVAELVELVRKGVDLGPAEVTTSRRILDKGGAPTEVLSQAILTARGKAILEDWATYRPKFRKVMPVEYRRALQEMERSRMNVAAE